MMIIRRNVRFWGAAILLGAVCAGCNTTKAASDLPADTPSGSAPRFGQVTPVPQLAVNPPAISQQQQQQVVQPVDTTVTPPPQEASLATQTAPSDKKVQTSSDKKPEEDKKDSPAIESYDVKKPSLMGIRLTDKKAAVIEKFDEPDNEFEMDDEKDPITVYEYDGFTVGFNAADTVEFVEITSKDVNPGLNGLHLGQKVKDAETALGKPDTNTNYALHYKTDKTVLKLDIDPKTETIQSIKLFANRP